MATHRASTARSGFTLVEMSIVLAIIGLLTGGVMAGQFIIRRAQISSIVTDLAKFKTAFNQFKDQYPGLPGDILDATEYWGTDGDGCPSHSNRVPKKETCNGNGDETIGSADGGTTWSEPFRAWQQLSDAGFIEEVFTGVAGSSGKFHATPATAMKNIPAGRINNTGYTLMTQAPMAASGSDLYAHSYGNLVQYGAARAANDTSRTAVLSAREMASLDGKIDDGKPGTGEVVAFLSTLLPDCTTSDTATTAQYKLTQKGMKCSFMYILD